MRTPHVRHVGLVAALTLTAAIVLAVVQALCARRGIDAGLLTRDVASAAHVSLYVGVISNFGLCLWAAAASCAALAWAVVRKHAASREVALALAGFAALSAVLGMDDGIELHEYVFPVYLHVAQRAVLAFYAISAAAWAIRFRAVLLARVPVALGVALCAFAVSVLADELADHMAVPMILEDGAKLVGQLNWLATAALLAMSAITESGEVPVELTSRETRRVTGAEGLRSRDPLPGDPSPAAGMARLAARR